MPRASEISKSSGRELIGQTQEIWQEYREKIPRQQRHDLGQVLTEMGSRINYACNGQQPETKSKYATLGGSELASHAQKTVQRVTQQLPVSVGQQLSWVVSEMASRVRYAAEGALQTQTSSGGEGFDFEREQEQSQQTSTFA